MQLDERLKNVAVIGAAGKMGSGISALLNQEMSRLEAEKKGSVGTGSYLLTLIDTNEQALFSLKKYLRSQLLKFAEKNINLLRKYYINNPALVSNREIIDRFVEGGLDQVRLETELSQAKNAFLIFEAIAEDVKAKIETFKSLKDLRSDVSIFSNTSSIPISLMSHAAHLQGRIVGFHFYNPPLIQKLVELIIPEDCHAELKQLALELAKRLNKVVVHSRDVAGFIGNGHFIREVLFACKLAREVSEEHSCSLEKAIYLVDEITGEYLIRPMGIFQLIDYVGIDICRNIAAIMRTHLPAPELQDRWLDAMYEAGALGGQSVNGMQKEGCFRYQNNQIQGVFNLQKRAYEPVADFKTSCKQMLEPFPQGHYPWKALQNHPDREARVSNYLKHLQSTDSFAVRLAKRYLSRSREIANQLVEQGVASSGKDVDMVLKNGFFHLYGTLKDTDESI